MSIVRQMTKYTNDDITEIKKIYHDALQSSPRLAQIHQQGQERFRLESSYIKRLIKNNKSLYENSAVNSEKLLAKVQGILQEEINHIKTFNAQCQLAGYKPGDKGSTYQLLTNRMQLILEFALQLTFEDTVFYDLLNGKLTQGYSVDVPLINYFPQNEHIYSNGKRGNSLKTLLIMTWYALKDSPSIQHLVNSDKISLDNHFFMHILPLPNDFDTIDIKKSRLFYSDDKTVAGLIVIHNGYAFGGQRREPRYSNGKEWGPEDCSSFVAKKTNCPILFSTFCLTSYYQAKKGFLFPELKSDIVNKWHQESLKWQETKEAEVLNKLYIPLDLNIDPQSIKPGSIYLWRAYKGIMNNPEIALTGTDSHISFFLGVTSDGMALTIGTRRELEDVGMEFTYGVQKDLLQNTNDNKIMFFDVVEE